MARPGAGTSHGGGVCVPAVREAVDVALSPTHSLSLSDAVTSILAITGLLMGRIYGFVWMDALVGIVGAGVIISWAVGLVRSSGAVLLDVVPNRRLAELARARLETGDDRVVDLHLWQVGPGPAAMIAAIVSDRPQTPASYKARLDGIAGLSHVTIEVHPCPDHVSVAA